MANKSLIWICFGLLSLSISTLSFADWSANFEPPSKSTSSLKIVLPEELDIITLTTLGVELDGIDITALLSLDGSNFLYTPIEPLANGQHTIRLVMFDNDGNTVPKNDWSFTITETDTTSLVPSEQQIQQAEAWIRSSSFEADTLTEFSNRAHQHNIGSAPDHSIISGAGNVRGALQGEKWSVDAQGNYLIQSDTDLALTGNALDLGEYKISANYDGTSVSTGMTLGHHDIGINSMLFSSFQRRGVSAHIADNTDRISANAFAFRPKTQVGARDFTGLSDSNDRLEGVSASVKPFSNDQHALKITGIYYDGEGDTGGIGIGGEQEVSTGSGYGLILEKKLLEGKLDFRAEYARAHYDADGSAALAPEDRSDAISMLLEARPFENLILLDKYMDIVIGAKYERIDTFFESLANQGIAADRDAITVYSNLYWGSFSANLQFVNETNNVDDLISSPTDEFQNIAWSTNYAFNPQTGARAWLGAPYLNFSGFISTLEREDTPSGYLGNDTDNASNSITLGGGSNYKDWYWSASHTYASLEDDTNTTSDTVSNYSSLSAAWTVSDRLELNGDLQYGIFEDQDNDTESYSTNMNFGLRSALIKNKLDLSLTYNLNLANGDNDSPDKHIINSELGWTIQQTGNNRPGLSLALRGSMEKTNANTTTTTDETQYQLFAIFRITAPYSSNY